MLDGVTAADSVIKATLLGWSLISTGAAALVISRSNSALAFWNSPKLLPRPRASSGNFLAPNINRQRKKINTNSGNPGVESAIKKGICIRIPIKARFGNNQAQNGSPDAIRKNAKRFNELRRVSGGSRNLCSVNQVCPDRCGKTISGGLGNH